MTGIEIISASDKRLFDRVEFLDCMINIEGWEFNHTKYEDEQHLIYGELEKRTAPKRNELIVIQTGI